MKSSPLQLNWVSYPQVSYEVVEEFDSDVLPPLAANVDATVTYRDDGTHFAQLRVEGAPDGVVPYRFELTAMCSFRFDLEIAKSEYKGSNLGLPPIIAVNVSRILYSGIREHLAHLTARAPYGPAMLESTLIEPNDVKINSESAIVETLKKLFEVSNEDLESMNKRLRAKAASSDRKGKVLGSRAKKQVTQVE